MLVYIVQILQLNLVLENSTHSFHIGAQIEYKGYQKFRFNDRWQFHFFSAVELKGKTFQPTWQNLFPLFSWIFSSELCL